MIKIVHSHIVTAFDEMAIGSKVMNHEEFYDHLSHAINAYDFASCRVPGQGYILVPDVVKFVSAGVGHRTVNSKDYVVREHRGRVDAYLKREYAAEVTGCACVVYTRDAYFADPQLDEKEYFRVDDSGATHILVAVLAFAGPPSPLSPYRFVANMAGGNKEALAWGADEIRVKAAEVIAYDKEWVAVAD